MSPGEVVIGVHVHAEPAQLGATLDALAAHTSPDVRVILLPDGPDWATGAALQRLELPRLGTDQPRGAAACFNRLAAGTEAPIVVLLESGSLVAEGWLDRLLAGLAADGRHGLAGPSTNLSWNEQAAFREARGNAPSEIARAAREAASRFGDGFRLLAPLYSLADFCYVVRREVIEAVGAADEGYGLGPCWEMDYNVRAARAGFAGIWVGGAYVHRLPATPRRRSEEARLFATSRRRYQDRFCGYRLRQERTSYEPHCKGDACAEFAPPGLIAVRAPLAKLEAAPTVAPVPAIAPPAIAPPAVAPPAPPAPPPAPEPAAVAPRIEAAGPGFAVTCIMPTCNRRSFVPQAIRYFLRQDFTDAELLILDDGDQPAAPLVPAHPRIRYVREGGRLSVGAKRNRACELATGALIAHWDDDDWYAPGRLGRQVEALFASGRDLCGTSQELFYEAASGRAWRYVYGGTPGAFLNGASLVYRRALWERLRFADVQIAEDVRFVAAAGVESAVDLADSTLVVGLIHPGNTSPKRTSTAVWSPVPAQTVERLLGPDLAFWRTAGAAGGAPAAPLVSCIMPTADRRAFVAHSLRLFAAQDYPRRELVVVDDGRHPVRDLVEAAPGTRYLRLDGRTSIGEKRNAAVRAAKGTVIVHWDDDDWYGETRLSHQVAPILCGLADLTGLESRYLLELPAGTFWTMKPALHSRMFVGDVHGGTLAYDRALFDGGIQYPPSNLAEDAAFIRRAVAGGKRLARLANPGLFVYVRHGENAWRFRAGQFLDRKGWSPTDPPEGFSPAELQEYRNILLGQ